MEAPTVKPSIESVIAERILVRNDLTPSKMVTVLVSKPIRPKGENDFHCEVQILGLGDEKVRPIYGFDSMQALQLALRFVSEQLESHRKNLRWVDNEDIGF
jgi:hypothetical protein